jgi:hypothetical protein
MTTTNTDDAATVAAIGLLAYMSADVAHHALGHGGACLALGGTINRLSSVVVDCTQRGSNIDLAGPLANLALGLLALIPAHTVHNATQRLFWILVAAFNLFWIEMQLAFSAATRTDDWGWFLQETHTGNGVRYGLIAAGVVAYALTTRVIARGIAPFAQPTARARRMLTTAWLAAGGIAGLTAWLDPNAGWVFVHRAIPQSLILSIGLLFVPNRAAARGVPSEGVAPTLTRSARWISAAFVVGVASVALLGPGLRTSR